MLISTHYMDEAEALADRIGKIHNYCLGQKFRLKYEKNLNKIDEF